MCQHAAVDRGRNVPGLFRPRWTAALKYACFLGRHAFVRANPGRRLRLTPLRCALGYDVLPLQGKDKRPTPFSRIQHGVLHRQSFETVRDRLGDGIEGPYRRHPGRTLMKCQWRIG